MYYKNGKQLETTYVEYEIPDLIEEELIGDIDQSIANLLKKYDIEYKGF
jgi:hypothetical protein